jgi:endonuclease/exonuclease/phosphatase family metal-dependent hydrolase
MPPSLAAGSPRGRGAPRPAPRGTGTGNQRAESGQAEVQRKLGYRYLSRTHVPSGQARVLCGDFNSPRRVGDDGYVLTWAQNERTGKLRRDRGQRWDAAERSVIAGLRAFDLANVFDQAPETGSRNDPTWVANNGVGRRFDHIFASEALLPTACGYAHGWREHGLSDHSAVWADFNWPS